LPGAPLARPANEESWIDQLAGALAEIHNVPVGALPADYRRNVKPADLIEQRLGRWAPRILLELRDDIGDALRTATPQVISNGEVLTHHDFWFGNTLWSGEKLTGIVDWDGAVIDDPAFDVAYARIDMQLVLGDDGPDRLLRRYAARRGPLHSVPFWDLLTLLPAFRWLEDWVVGYREVGRDEITDELARERVEAFARRALAAL
jgi:aminoglycoside phosphotransferase (APT) family kinase protein